MALTQAQKNLVIEAMGDDIQRRRVDQSVVIQELLELLFKTKSVQKAELIRIVSAYRARKEETIAGFDSEALATKTNLQTKVTDLLAVETELAAP